MNAQTDREQAAVERAEMARDIVELTAKVEKLSSDIEGLVEAWRNANFAVALIKWLAGVVIAASAVFAAVTHFGKGA